MQGSPGPLLRMVRDQRVAFLAVGVTNTVIGYAWFVLFQLTIGLLWGYMASLAFAHILSVLCAFVLYRRFVFKVTGHIWRDLARFELVYLVAIAINFAALPLLVEIVRIRPLPAQALIVLVTAFISYFGHKRFSFRRLLPEEAGPAELADMSEAEASIRVSIVVPAFNNADYIESTMRSILTQSHPHLEILVADHGSTDDTWRLLQQYSNDSRVTLLKTEPGGGALANWNRVSQAASGDYIKLVCGDDLIYPDSVAKQVRALSTNPGAVLAASERDIVDANGRRIIDHRGLAGLRGLVSGCEAIRRTVTSGTNIFGEPGCVLIRREVLQRVGWWDASYPYLIDEATFTRVLLEGDFVAVPGSGAAFRMSGGQWSVRLAKHQSEQAVSFHRRLRSEHPEIVSRLDLFRGNLAARVMAITRRVAYVLLAGRMRR